MVPSLIILNLICMKHKTITTFLLIICSFGLFAQSDEIRHAIKNYQYNQAIALLEEEPAERDNLLLMSDCYEKLFNYESALSVYEQLLEDYPDEPGLLISAAECASKAGNSGLSLQYWVRTGSILPDNSFIQTQKVLAYYKDSKWDDTIEQAKIVFEKDSVPILLRVTGDAYLKTDYADSAKWFYLKAIEKNPSDYLSVHNLSGIYMKQEFFDGVIDVTDAYLENINPDQQVIGQLNGVAHYSAGNYKEATERLKNNTLLGDSSYTTCFYLGMSLYAGRLYYESVDWLEKAYFQQNHDVNLLYYFGTTLSRTYDRKRGIEVLSEGVDKIDIFIAMLYDFNCSFADAYLRSKNYSKAIEYYKSAYNRKSDANHHIYNIGYCYDLMGDYENTIRYYEQFLKTEPDNIEEYLGSGDAKYYIAARYRLEELHKERFFQSGVIN